MICAQSSCISIGDKVGRFHSYMVGWNVYNSFKVLIYRLNSDKWWEIRQT